MTITDQKRELARQYLARARAAECSAEREFWARLGRTWLDLIPANEQTPTRAPLRPTSSRRRRAARQ